MVKIQENSGFYNVAAAVFVFVASMCAYLTTVAPTVAFWDCGEYIGASHSLGIPHPPGNPLFVLMMRVASMFFAFFEDVGYRMNVAVALSSALTAMVLYLVIVEAGKLFIGEPDTVQKKITLSVGGIVGGLFAAFGYTFWFSAVETSVYNISMLVIAICTLLMLRWARSQKPDRDKLLILVAFLGFLGIGLHMYTMIIFPSAFLFMVLWDEKKRYDWRLWGTGICMAAIIYSLSAFLWLGPLTLIVTFIMSVTSKEAEEQKKWRLCFFFALFAIIGYSVHFFIPIRSALEPMINENHPSTWQSFIGFLERKQYGSESMVSRMFHRRGMWSHQFGVEGHMGFGGFHLTQFFRFDKADTELVSVPAGMGGAVMVPHMLKGSFASGFGKLMVYLIPTALMLYGWYYMLKKCSPAAVFLITLTLVTTIGMVFYMNFADGTRAEKFDYDMWMRNGQMGPMPTVHREVRVRDYFFTAGFMYFGMWIGMASCCLLHALFSAKDNFAKTVAAPAMAVLLAASPAIPYKHNSALGTRAGDWVAYDYAYNLLNSCEPNGILFTNGDNDTFPLWALQEAYGIRNDVRIVNLSLVNTDWYIKQLKKLEPRVPISFNEEQISDLQPIRYPFQEPVLYTLKKANISFMVPGMRQHPSPALRVQDIMVLNIVDANGTPDTTRMIRVDSSGVADTALSVSSNWQKPIYFAMTVSEDNYMGLTPFLRTEGLVYRLMQEPVTTASTYDLDRMIYLIDNVYTLRGIGKAKTNDTSRRLLTNYLQVAIDLRRAIEIAGVNNPNRAAHLESALRFMDTCVDLMPWDWRARAIRHELYMDNGMAQEAKQAMERAISDDPANISPHYRQMLDQATRALESGSLGAPAAPQQIPMSQHSQEELLERLQEALKNAQTQKGSDS